MKIRTQLKAGGTNLNHNEALRVRSTLKAGGWTNHNEALRVRSTLKAGLISNNHSEGLRVRSILKAGTRTANHNETLQVRSTLKAGGREIQHNEALRRESDRLAISMRKHFRTITHEHDRLRLLVVRAGLRAGRSNARPRERK